MLTYGDVPSGTGIVILPSGRNSDSLKKASPDISAAPELVPMVPAVTE